MKAKPAKQIGEWANTYSELYDLAFKHFEDGMPLEVRTRGRQDRDQQYGIFRIFPLDLRKYYEGYISSSEQIERMIAQWG